MKLKKLIGVWIFAVSNSAWVAAADKDDFYAAASVGPRIGASQTQFGTQAGYCPIDNWGFGLFFSQTSAPSRDSVLRDTTVGGIEARLFLEPFELRGAMGSALTRYSDKNAQNYLLLILGGAYLIPLTSSLAVRLDLDGEFPFQGSLKNSVFTGAGMRLLF